MHYEGANPLYYTVLLTISIIVGIIIYKKMDFPGKQNGVDYKYILPVVIIGAIIGAKIPVLVSYGFRKELLWTGKTYYGAIIGGFLAINIFKWIYRIKGYFGDRFVVPLAAAAGIGKIGCFLFGCCSGKPTDSFFSVKNAIGKDVYPVQIYEMIFQFLCAVIFYCLYKKKKYMGSHFIMYIIIYGVFRFLIEFIRIEPQVLSGLTVYQWMAVIFTPVFTVILYRRLKYD